MIKVYLVLLVGILSVSVSSILIKLANDVPAIIISTYRLIISSIILISLLKIKHVTIKSINSKDLLVSALSGFFLCIHFFSWIASIKYTSIASSVTLVSTSPVFVIIFKLAFFREKPNPFTLIATILAIGGSALIAYSDSSVSASVDYPNPFFGDILAVVGAIAVSVYFMAGERLRVHMTTLNYITLVYGFAAIFTFIIALFSSKPFFGYRPISYAYMLLMAIVPQIFGHGSFNWALRYINANAVAIATLGEPIGASILAYLFFDQTVSMIKFIGMAVVITSIALAVHSASSTG